MLSYQLKSGFHLSLLQKRHATMLFEFLEQNREAYTGVLGFIDRITDEKAVEGFIGRFLQMFIEETGFLWGIWDDSCPIGAVIARDISPIFHCAEIAYFIDKKYEGRGIASESVQVVIRHLFEEYKIERLVLKCDINSERSQNIAKRYSFTKEGIERHSFLAAGKYQDMYLWSLLKNEYENLKSGRNK